MNVYMCVSCEKYIKIVQLSYQESDALVSMEHQ
jgi:hypothetical protein